MSCGAFQAGPRSLSHEPLGIEICTPAHAHQVLGQHVVLLLREHLVVSGRQRHQVPNSPFEALHVLCVRKSSQCVKFVQHVSTGLRRNDKYQLQKDEFKPSNGNNKTNPCIQQIPPVRPCSVGCRVLLPARPAPARGAMHALVERTSHLTMPWWALRTYLGDDENIGVVLASARAWGGGDFAHLRTSGGRRWFMSLNPNQLQSEDHAHTRHEQCRHPPHPGISSFRSHSRQVWGTQD